MWSWQVVWCMVHLLSKWCILDVTLKLITSYCTALPKQFFYDTTISGHSSQPNHHLQPKSPLDNTFAAACSVSTSNRRHPLKPNLQPTHPLLDTVFVFLPKPSPSPKLLNHPSPPAKKPTPLRAPKCNSFFPWSFSHWDLHRDLEAVSWRRVLCIQKP